ncbi:hypothetical protein BLA60_03920 [Actinophytocola xinjiangensis]|uniref:YbaB/EbfC DNA-binding family protein n=1 Tax=Actinophytocola xinjiangensis TaxID=485602 RepID=A0A7Z0WSX5_9PSEU|nr:hypothetical protein [Actinophytocola xinjiangensis]OLF14292.1 hypothetical protein BLA60_03920 [Actinophytocola xinjiangensis]
MTQGAWYDEFEQPFDDDEERQRLPRQPAASRAAPVAAPPVTDQGAEFTGRSEDGSVVVTVRGRRLVAVTVAEAPARVAAGVLAQRVATAVNNALLAARAAQPVAEDPVPDLGGLVAQLEAVSAYSDQFMRRVEGAINDVIVKVGERTGMRGDPSAVEVGELVAEVVTTAKVTNDALGAARGPRASGGGADSEDAVRVDIDDTGLVAQVRLTTTAAGMSGDQFAGSVREAVNEALDDWAEQREQDPAVAVDLDHLTARAEALRSRSVEQLRGYTTNLRTIMGSIGEP